MKSVLVKGHTLRKRIVHGKSDVRVYTSWNHSFYVFFEATIPFYVQYNMFGLSNSCHQQNSKDSRILYMLVVESYAWTQHMIEKLMLLYG